MIKRVRILAKALLNRLGRKDKVETIPEGGKICRPIFRETIHGAKRKNAINHE